MKGILAVFALMLVAACSSATMNTTPGAVGGGKTGAATSREAVDMFFSSMKAGDLQAVSTVWGSKKGSSRETLSRDEIETRVIYMQRCFSADKYRVTESPFQRRDSAYYKVELTKGSLLGETSVVAVTGPDLRWYVAQADIGAVAPLCRT